MRRFALTAAAVLAADATSKAAVAGLLPAAVQLHDLPADNVAMVVVAVALAGCARIARPGVGQVAAGLAAGGVLGNGLERAVGPVIDWIGPLPLGAGQVVWVNLADLAIVAGAVGLLTATVARRRGVEGCARA